MLKFNICIYYYYYYDEGTKDVRILRIRMGSKDRKSEKLPEMQETIRLLLSSSEKGCGTKMIKLGGRLK